MTGPTLPSTALTQLVGCRLPIQQAAMGGVTTPELAAAVARTGALGMLAGAGLTGAQVEEQLAAASAAAGDGARLGVGFLMPFLDLAAFEAAAAGAPLVECFYGDPDPALVARAHGADALVAWQVGSRDEALAAADAGADVVVVQGTEAGGHVRGREPLHAVLEATRSVVTVPIVAAGGMGSGAAIAAALQAGADGVRIGTRLVATAEADVHRGYVDALIDARAADTVLTEAFSMAWPHAPHRVLRSAVEATDELPELRSPLPPTRAFVGPVEQAALYAGTSVDGVTTVATAADVIDELVREAAAALAGE